MGFILGSLCVCIQMLSYVPAVIQSTANKVHNIEAKAIGNLLISFRRLVAALRLSPSVCPFVRSCIVCVGRSYYELPRLSLSSQRKFDFCVAH